MFRHYLMCRKQRVDFWSKAARLEYLMRENKNLESALNIEQRLNCGKDKWTGNGWESPYRERIKDIEAAIKRFDDMIQQWKVDELRKWIVPCKHGAYPCVDGSTGHWNFMFPLCHCKNFVAKSIYRGILKHNFRNGLRD